ncbi:MAG: tape measure protein [Prevotella sp.]|nr:tape measure protein [Prevotella sp.]
MAEDEGLHFVATIDNKDIVAKAEETKSRIGDVTGEVERLGLTVDQFVKGLKGLTASVNSVADAVSKSAAAQQAAAKAQDEATQRSLKGASETTDSVRRTGDAFDETGTKAKKMGDDGAGAFSKLTKYAAGFFTLQAAEAFGRKVFAVRQEMESLQTSFRILVGDQAKADKLFGSIKEFAVSTPMQMKDLASAAQTMMGFGIPLEQIMENLKAIGDVSMGDAQKFQGLALSFSQMSAAGKLMGQDLMQMINAGFNPLAVISEKTGKSIGELKDEMSKGAISADMVRQAFIDATSEGGKFNGMLEAQSKTLKGAYSNLQGAVSDMLDDIGVKMQGTATAAIESATWLAKNYEKVGAAILGLVGTYGAYKAALMMATLAESGLTVVEAVHYGWLVAQKKAQELLNATMLSNPYVAVAVALGMVCTAIGVYVAGAKDADQATERLNKTFADTQAEISSELKKIDELFDRLRKAKKGTDDYKSAKSAIISQYGGYLSGLSAEIVALNDVEGAYKAVAKAARDAAMARGMEAAMRSAQDSYGEKYSTNYDKIYNAIAENYGEERAKQLMEGLSRKLRNDGQLDAGVIDKFGALKGVKAGWLVNLSVNESRYQDERDKIRRKFGDAEAPKAQPKTTGPKKWTDQDFEDEIKSKTSQLNALSEKQAKGKEGAALKKEIAALQARRKAAFSTTEGARQSKAAASAAAKAERQRQAEERKALQTAIRDAEAMEKAVGLTEKQQVERSRAERDLELSTREATIKAMEEGTDKTIAQIELDYDREMEAIRRGNEDIRQKRIDEAKALWDADPKKKGSNFYESEAYKEASEVSYTDAELRNMEAREALAEKVRSDAREKLHKQEREAMIAHLKEYGDIEQQKLAITQKYEEKISEARKKGGSPYEISSLEMERDSQLRDLSAKAVEERIDWGGVFSSLEGHTKEYLEGLRSQLEALLVGGSLPVDQMATIQEKLRDINAAISEQGNLFTFVSERTREHNRLLQASADARAALDAALAKQTEAETNLSLVRMGGGSKSDIITAEAKLNEARRKTAAATIKAKQAEDAAAERAADSIARKFADAAEWVNTYLGDLPELLGKLGLGNAGEKAQMGIDAVNAAAGAAADFASGNYVGAALKAFNALDNLGNIVGVGGLSDPKLEADIERLTQSNENLQKAIDALADQMEDASVLDVKEIYDQQKKMLEQTAAQTREMMSRSGAAYNSGFWGTGIGGSGSSNKKINKALSASDWQMVSKAAGKTIRDAAGFWTLSSKEMYQVMRDANAQWTVIMDKANDGTADAAKFMNDYIELWKKQEELENAYKERWTNVSFDSVKDSFLSALSDMDRSASSFSQDFTKYLFDAVMNAQVGDYLNDQLKGWYDNFSKYMESGAGELTDAEISSLRDQWDAIVSEGVAMRDSISRATGYGSSSEGSATYNAAKSFTQEQGDILNGRLTAIQINTATNTALGRQIASSLQSMASIASCSSSTNTAVLEIRNMMIYTNSYLEDVARYAKKTYDDFGEKMDRIILHTQNL